MCPETCHASCIHEASSALTDASKVREHRYHVHEVHCLCSSIPTCGSTSGSIYLTTIIDSLVAQAASALPPSLWFEASLQTTGHVSKASRPDPNHDAKDKAACRQTFQIYSYFSSGVKRASPSHLGSIRDTYSSYIRLGTRRGSEWFEWVRSHRSLSGMSASSQNQGERPRRGRESASLPIGSDDVDVAMGSRHRIL